LKGLWLWLSLAWLKNDKFEEINAIITTLLNLKLHLDCGRYAALKGRNLSAQGVALRFIGSEALRVRLAAMGFSPMSIICESVAFSSCLCGKVFRVKEVSLW